MSKTGRGLHQRTHTPPNTSNLDPSYSPDGRQIVNYASRSGHFEIYAMKATGAGLKQLTHTASSVQREDPSWQPLAGP
jgi:Tol biopolymer transport system component